MVKEVGEHNVVQIITNTYKKAGMKLARHYNLYRTLCVAHSIELMLKDVGKRATVVEVIKNRSKVTKFIYNRGIILSKMREDGQQ